MRLDQALVDRELVSSRTEAQELIARGEVAVNGAAILKPSKGVEASDSISVTANRRFVSRGGDKLLGAILGIHGEHVRLTGKHVLDIGSSTGGFTDCMLQLGAFHVDAVDVGTDQLHSTLRHDSRVSVFERTDIRSFETGRKYDIVTVDLSFISLQHVFEKILSLCTQGTEVFILIKPQFEVGKGNTKKGIVKDEEIVRDLLATYEDLAKAKLHNVRTLPCNLKGGDGNQEYFLYGIHG